MRVLIIEDDPIWQDRLSALVSELGLECDLASSWNSAFTKINSSKLYHRVVSDLSVGTDSDSGIQSLAIMSDKFNPPPTLIVTTYLDNRLQSRCAEILSIENAITKPTFNDHLEDFEAFMGVGKLPYPTQARIGSMKNNSVFVVHGRDLKFRSSIFSFLRTLGLDPIEWGDAINLMDSATPYIGDIIDRSMEHCQAVLVLLTPDDEVRLKKNFQENHDPKYEKVLSGQARPNVLFEAGLAFGKLPSRTIFVSKSDVKPFSDVVGRHIIHFSDTQEFRVGLANRLEKAGCKVNRAGTDWINVEL